MQSIGGALRSKSAEHLPNHNRPYTTKQGRREAPHRCWMTACGSLPAHRRLTTLVRQTRVWLTLLKHSLFEVIGTETGRPGAGNDLRAPTTCSTETTIGRGGGAAGIVEGSTQGCFAFISLKTSEDGRASPMEVRDCRAFLY